MKYIKDTSCTEGAKKIGNNNYKDKKLRRRHKNLRSPFWEKKFGPPLCDPQKIFILMSLQVTTQPAWYPLHSGF